MKILKNCGVAVAQSALGDAWTVFRADWFACQVFQVATPGPMSRVLPFSFPVETTVTPALVHSC